MGCCREGAKAAAPQREAKSLPYVIPSETSLFTIHSYLFLSPTQVGDAGRVREPMYWYRGSNVSVCGTALSLPRFLNCIVTGRVRALTYWYKVGSVIVCVTDAKKPRRMARLFLFVLALPIFPASHPASIVGADELNFCVRDGNRWTLIAINTNSYGRR